MSEGRRIVVNLEQSPSQAGSPQISSWQTGQNSPSLEPPKKRRSLFSKILAVLGILLLLLIIVGAAGCYWWWSSVQKSPAYSLALLIDAARKDDKPTVETLLDTNAVVDDFIPQITAKATERYGRGLPPATVQKATAIFQPILQQMLPQIKEIARQRIPQIVKEKAQDAPEVSPLVMAVGIGRIVDIEQTGDTAFVKASAQDRSIEFTMKQDGERWKIVSVKDDTLADRIAQQVAETIQKKLNEKAGGSTRQPTKNTVEELRKQLEQLGQ